MWCQMDMYQFTLLILTYAQTILLSVYLNSPENFISLLSP